MKRKCRIIGFGEHPADAVARYFHAPTCYRVHDKTNACPNAADCHQESMKVGTGLQVGHQVGVTEDLIKQ